MNMEQYNNADKLNTRIKIHEKYSENKQNFHAWVFENLHLKEEMKILECGCGPGALWYNNKNKIPNGCEITLLDMSEGMLRAAKDNIGEIDNVKFNYINGDVQNLKFDDCAFDIVIANHMLYHVDDIIKALNELKRVLKIDGTIYASTFSLLHMKELNDLLFTFIPNKLPNTSDRFCLENGAYYMLNVFENVKLKRHFDCLKVKSADDLMAYLLSRTKVKKQLDKNMINSIFDIINKTIEKEGYFYIRKDAILFLCKREN